jgi:hypothetical protein
MNKKEVIDVYRGFMVGSMKLLCARGRKVPATIYELPHEFVIEFPMVKIEYLNIMQKIVLYRGIIAASKENIIKIDEFNKLKESIKNVFSKVKSEVGEVDESKIDLELIKSKLDI